MIKNKELNFTILENKVHIPSIYLNKAKRIFREHKINDHCASKELDFHVEDLAILCSIKDNDFHNKKIDFISADKRLKCSLEDNHIIECKTALHRKSW